MTEKKGGSAMNDTPKAELRVVLETDGPKIELRGTRSDILTAWAWLTLSICSNFDIPTDFLAAKMPALLKFLKETIRGQTLVDMSGLSNPEVIEKLAAENEALRNPPLTLEELRARGGITHGGGTQMVLRTPAGGAAGEGVPEPAAQAVSRRYTLGEGGEK